MVQVDQAAKVEVAQWIGHRPWLHAWVSAVCGHALPPNLGWVTARLRDCEKYRLHGARFLAIVINDHSPCNFKAVYDVGKSMLDRDVGTSDLRGRRRRLGWGSCPFHIKTLDAHAHVREPRCAISYQADGKSPCVAKAR